jgi:hypothetical protein
MELRQHAYGSAGRSDGASWALRSEVSEMPNSASDALDDAIIMLAAHAHDLAERDLDLPENSEQLRTTALAILHRLDQRERLTIAWVATV